MAKISRIMLYPVKSLDATEVSSADVLASGGLLHDRRYALCDSSGQIVNGKRCPAIHKVRTKYSKELNLVGFSIQDQPPVNGELNGDRALLEQFLSDSLGIEVHFIENEQGFPDDTVSRGPTVVSTATLETVAEWFPSMTVDEVRRRFRANLEIEDVPAFWEDRLVAPEGQVVQFRVGELILEGTNPCQRCSVPPRDSRCGEVDKDFTTTFVRNREQHLPSWAVRERFDHFYRLTVNTRLAEAPSHATITIGDTVEKLGTVNV